MPRLSAALLPYRRTPKGVEVMLVHPGGPFWAKKDAGAWSLPKGEYDESEEPQMAAKREFTEETGLPAPSGELIDIGEVKYGNKKVVGWAVEADLDASNIASNMITIDWPPRSGQTMEIPECDRAGWFSLAKAESKLVKGQVPFIQTLAEKLNIGDSNQLSLL